MIRIWPYGRIGRMEACSHHVAAAVRTADQGPPALTVVDGPNDAGPDGTEACDPPTLLFLLAAQSLYKQRRTHVRCLQNFYKISQEIRVIQNCNRLPYNIDQYATIMLFSRWLK